MSHSWKDLLAQKNTLDARGGNSYVNWGKITPKQDALIEAILSSPLHVIATMRAKMDHVMDTDDKGKVTVRKVGLAPIQRDDVEYEFDIVADMDINNNMIVSKSRCSALSGKVIEKPDMKIAEIIKTWLSDGAKVEDAPQIDLKATSSVSTVETSNHKDDVQPVEPDALTNLKNAVLGRDEQSGFKYDRVEMFNHAGKTLAGEYSAPERNNTIIAMEGEGKFQGVTSYDEALNLLIARLKSPEHGKQKAKAG